MLSHLPVRREMPPAGALPRAPLAPLLTLPRGASPIMNASVQPRHSIEAALLDSCSRRLADTVTGEFMR